MGKKALGYNVPLVLGTPEMRPSGDVAIRNALAMHLNTPSARWWPLRP